MAFVAESGDQGADIIVKTDQESAIKYVVEEIEGEREDGKTVVEEAPKGSHASNGVIERGGANFRGAHSGDVVRVGG